MPHPRRVLDRTALLDWLFYLSRVDAVAGLANWRLMLDGAIIEHDLILSHALAVLGDELAPPDRLDTPADRYARMIVLAYQAREYATRGQRQAAEDAARLALALARE